MDVEVIALGPFETNAVILWTKERQAIVADPGSEVNVLCEFLDRNQLRPVAYLLTHGHVDHVSALAELNVRFPAPMYMHPDDAAWAFSPTNQLPPYYAPPKVPAKALVPVIHNQEIEFPDVKVHVIHTPGHSPGGVCYYLEKERILLSGDTLFCGSVGRSDLQGGNPNILSRSLKKLAELPELTRVIPGHGPETTIAREKRTNYFLRGEQN